MLALPREAPRHGAGPGRSPIASAAHSQASSSLPMNFSLVDGRTRWTPRDWHAEQAGCLAVVNRKYPWRQSDDPW